VSGLIGAVRDLCFQKNSAYCARKFKREGMGGRI